MDITSYDKIIVYFSGGKDSLACLLNLFNLGVDPSKIELWHHEIDGREGSTLMDWPITPDYCRKIAAAFNIPIYFSWKVGGFEREMLRHNALTAPTKFETPNEGIKQVGGTRGKANTRLKFPQVSANLSVRWCSAYLKIDVGAAAIRNQKRFNNSRTLTISGERAEESTARANYKTFEPDRSDNRNGRNARHVDRWRAVHSWTEDEVWAIIKQYSINPPPAYWLGWGRVSCQFCIFGSDNQCSSSQAISPGRFSTIALYEADFGLTIHRTKAVSERTKIGEAYSMEPRMIEIANSTIYDEPVRKYDWRLPPGAFGESCGPT
jgi:3'-phosphoadenosine 5'-phosphosulfate sulfotransferase (PAPS reductase)/FAD synthetase